MFGGALQEFLQKLIEAAGTYIVAEFGLICTLIYKYSGTAHAEPHLHLKASDANWEKKNKSFVRSEVLGSIIFMVLCISYNQNDGGIMSSSCSRKKEQATQSHIPWVSLQGIRPDRGYEQKTETVSCERLTYSATSG